MQILHTVYLGLREDDNVEARIPECVALLNEQKGITASVPFTTAGAASPQTAAYVVVLVADSHEALHAYLHGDAHLNVWIPLIKPNLEEIVVFDHDLPTPFTGVAGSQALSLLLKLQRSRRRRRRPQRCSSRCWSPASATSTSLRTVATASARLPSSTSWNGLTSRKVSRARARSSHSHPTSSFPSAHLHPPPSPLPLPPGFTHCLTVVATGAAAIERLLRSAELKNWLTGLAPQGHAAMVSPLEPSHEVAYPIYRDLASKHVLITGGAQP